MCNPQDPEKKAIYDRYGRTGLAHGFSRGEAAARSTQPNRRPSTRGDANPSSTDSSSDRPHSGSASAAPSSDGRAQTSGQTKTPHRGGFHAEDGDAAAGGGGRGPRERPRERPDGHAAGTSFAAKNSFAASDSSDSRGAGADAETRYSQAPKNPQAPPQAPSPHVPLVGRAGRGDEAGKPPAIVRKLPLTLEEMYSGCEKKVVIERSIVDGASRRALALKEVYLVLVPVAVNDGAQLVYPGMSHIWCANVANLVRTCMCTEHACMDPTVWRDAHTTYRLGARRGGVRARRRRHSRCQSRATRPVSPLWR